MTPGRVTVLDAFVHYYRGRYLAGKPMFGATNVMQASVDGAGAVTDRVLQSAL